MKTKPNKIMQILMSSKNGIILQTLIELNVMKHHLLPSRRILCLQVRVRIGQDLAVKCLYKCYAHQLFCVRGKASFLAARSKCYFPTKFN